MTNPLPPPARNRLTRELRQLSTAPPPGVAAYVVDDSDLSKLQAEISGPEQSPFEDGVFLLSVQIPTRYPFEPPHCRFLKESAAVLYHPNIDSAGRICLDTLKSPPVGSWSPAVSLPSLLLTIRTLLSAPNGDDPLDPEIAQIFRRDPEQWKREAMRRVKSSGASTMNKLKEGDNNDNTSTNTNTCDININTKHDRDDGDINVDNDTKSKDEAGSNSFSSIITTKKAKRSHECS